MLFGIIMQLNTCLLFVLGAERREAVGSMAGKRAAGSRAGQQAFWALGGLLAKGEHIPHTAYPDHIPHTTAHQCNKSAPKMTIFEVFQKISAAARASKYREKFSAAARGWLLHGRHSHAARRRSARALIQARCFD